MMTMGLWAAITFLLLASLIESVVFRKRRMTVKRNAQCFKFHELRDKLQLLTVQGKIRIGSRLHGFLMFTINVAIKNAGVIKLSDVAKISRMVKSEADGEFEKLQRDTETHSSEVQALASEVCGSFAMMLVTNDDLTALLFKGLGILTELTNDAVVGCVKWTVSKMAPNHVQVVREANDYSRLGQRLAPSY
jgi:hypothetical protein